MIDKLNINFAVYKDSTEFLGIAKATLPDISWLNSSISGVGIAGNIDAVVPGHLEAMTLSLDFRNVTDEAVSLAAPTRHQIELRAARQDEDPAEGKLVTTALKHVFVVIPKTYKPGSVAPAATADGSGEYTVRYWKMSIDGDVKLEIDPLNFKCVVNGVDYLADTKKALGKSAN